MLRNEGQSPALSDIQPVAPEKPAETPEQVFADPRPAKRIRASKAEWTRIREQFAHECCVACGLPANHLHHVVFKKADRGDDVVANLVPICTSCHDRFHSHGIGWERIARHIRAYVMARHSRLDYVIGKMGEELWERRYPPPEGPDVGWANSYRNPDSWLREGGIDF